MLQRPLEGRDGSLFMQHVMRKTKVRFKTGFTKSHKATVFLPTQRSAGDNISIFPSNLQACFIMVVNDTMSGFRAAIAVQHRDVLKGEGELNGYRPG